MADERYENDSGLPLFFYKGKFLGSADHTVIRQEELERLSEKLAELHQQLISADDIFRDWPKEYLR